MSKLHPQKRQYKLKQLLNLVNKERENNGLEPFYRIEQIEYHLNISLTDENIEKLFVAMSLRKRV